MHKQQHFVLRVTLSHKSENPKSVLIYPYMALIYRKTEEGLLYIEI